MIVVCDTSPITNLAAIGQLNLLQQLYSNIIIPQAVYDEMVDLDYAVPGAIEVQSLSWIQHQQVINRTLVISLLEHRFTNPKNPVSVTGKTEIWLTQQEETGFFCHNYEY